jgi:hypothetical protein
MKEKIILKIVTLILTIYSLSSCKTQKHNCDAYGNKNIEINEKINS